MDGLVVPPVVPDEHALDELLHRAIAARKPQLPIRKGSKERAIPGRLERPTSSSAGKRSIH